MSYLDWVISALNITTSLETAHWEWVKQVCPSSEGSRNKAKWIKSNPFESTGTRFTRTVTLLRSNSVKSIVQWQTIFRGSDEIVV